MIHFQPVAVALGAEVSGVDLSKPLDKSSIRSIREGLLEHQVLFFRDQAIEPQHQLAFAQAFGRPAPHPAYPHVEGFPEINILEVKTDQPPKIDTWHTDMTFKECPPLGSILIARAVPPLGGATMWASLFAAYDALSDPMKRYLASTTAVHSFEYGFRHTLAEPGARARLSETVEKNPPVVHPVIRTHPESGRKGVFVNRLFTTHLVGVPERESDAILSYLFEHIEVPEFACRFEWRENSIAFWDNRATLHRPINDYWPAHRRMERVTLDGDRPV